MKHVSQLISYVLILLLLSSCSKEKSIAESYYNNPPKDSVSFAYKLSTLYYTDFNNKETSFELMLDTIKNIYSWGVITINYEINNSIRKYTPVYDNGLIVSLLDNSFFQENIELEYRSIPPSNVKLISSLKYFRKTDPFALTFSYDSVNLLRVERHSLDKLSGQIGQMLESQEFCPYIDLGECGVNTGQEIFKHSAIFNNLYHSNELLPFILLLNNPNQSSLQDIIYDLPLYFSRHYPENIYSPIQANYELGLNSKLFPTYFYLNYVNLGLIRGYNFSMR